MVRILKSSDVMMSSDRIWTAAGTVTVIRHVDQLREISQIPRHRNVNVTGVIQLGCGTE